ncbi:hypothetical protein NDU88_001957 [Pleurodeles waltl]|uniref:Uncharacterized protein n=1 Tax=Pleurodeles waltl TaxID=8319 RepID=A0AAV7LER0_PLEWA|nr:hypothetical protein NDU88_001957 [Pleurodeles waltl]
MPGLSYPRIAADFSFPAKRECRQCFVRAQANLAPPTFSCLMPGLSSPRIAADLLSRKAGVQASLCVRSGKPGPAHILLFDFGLSSPGLRLTSPFHEAGVQAALCAHSGKPGPAHVLLFDAGA